MANINDLLAKQQKKAEKKALAATTTPKAAVRLERTGPTRPWQENLPQYKTPPPPALSETDTNGHETPTESAELDTAIRHRRRPADQLDTKNGHSAGSREDVLVKMDTNGHSTQRAVGQFDTEHGHELRRSHGQSDTENGHNRTQSLDQTDTNGHGARSDVDQSDTENGHSGESPGFSTRPGCQKWTQEMDTKEGVSISTAGCVQKDAPLCPIDRASSTPQMDTVSISTGVRVHLQTDTHSISNWTHTAAPKGLPTSGQMLAVLRFLVSQQTATGLGHTPRLKREAIAAGAAIPIGGVNTQVTRLCSRGYCERLESRRGRGEAGAVFRVPSPVIRLVSDPKRTQEIDSNGHKKWPQETDTLNSSSSPLKTTTTADDLTSKQLVERFELWLTRFACVDMLDANDLLKLWRGGAFDSLDDLAESTEHIVGYVRSEQGKGLGKGWIIKTLQSGYYARPAGFKSWEERQLEDKRRRIAERRERRREAFELDFDLWFEDLDNAERQKLAGGKAGQAAAFASPLVIKALLRNHFAREKGLHEFCTDEDGAPN